jgi:hypothetical protein
MNNNAQMTDEIMDIKSLCKYLKISRGTLSKLPIKKIHVRRRVLFQKSAVLEFLNENTKGIKNESK